MARYTTLLRSICEVEAGLQESSGNYREVIAQAAPKIFDFDFPFYDESKRQQFEENFLRHFYMQEIGAETVNLWKMWLEDKFNTVLPYYNKLWTALDTEYNFLFTDDYTETRTLNREHKRNTQENGNSTIESTTDGTGKAVTDSTANDTTDTTLNGTEEQNQIYKHSTTPQGSLNNMLDGSYLDEATQTTNDNTRTETTNAESKNNTNTETNTENTATTNGSTTTENTVDETRSEGEQETVTKQGRQGQSPAALMREYMEAQRNITQEFYLECADLFMLIY